MPQYDDQRRSPRIPFENLSTEMEMGGASYPVKIANLSQEGVRVVVDANLDVKPNEEVQIGVGAINPNIKGKVRWATPDPRNPSRMELGVEFETFIISQPGENEVQGLLEAWRELSQDYTFHESFLHILTMLDFEIVDGKIDDLSEAMYSICVWLDQRMGPLNLWRVLRERDGSLTPTVIVERHEAHSLTYEARAANVVRVAQEELTGWFEGNAYLIGGDVVIEFMGEAGSQTDLLQRLSQPLSDRIRLWSKMLMKNISLQLLSEQVEQKPP